MGKKSTQGSKEMMHQAEYLSLSLISTVDKVPFQSQLIRLVFFKKSGTDCKHFTFVKNCLKQCKVSMHRQFRHNLDTSQTQKECNPLTLKSSDILSKGWLVFICSFDQTFRRQNPKVSLYMCEPGNLSYWTLIEQKGDVQISILFYILLIYAVH